MASEVSYIDYEAFLDPTFSAAKFANELVLATNDQTDTTLDLATPLSRVLFDVQEVDTHIDKLTTTSALPLLQYTTDYTNAGSRLLERVEEQVAALTENYTRLEQNVVARYEAAEQVRLAADRLCQTVKLGRAVLRCLQSSRQLESLTEDLGSTKPIGVQNSSSMVTAAHTLLSLRAMLNHDDADTAGLENITLVSAVRSNIIASSERRLLTKSQQIIRDFSLSPDASVAQTLRHNTATFAQLKDLKAQTTSAVQVLCLLSAPEGGTSPKCIRPTLLLNALQSYLQTTLNTSLTTLARALAALPTLDRTLVDISARCRDILALESLLRNMTAPSQFRSSKAAEQSSQDDPPEDLLQPLLASLDTPSLPTWFWRSLASNLTSRVRDILNRGGVSARTLRSSRDSVAQSIRECVKKGSELEADLLGAWHEGQAGPEPAVSWEREAAVMIGSVTGQLGR